jgi:hypothetical protein
MEPEDDDRLFIAFAAALLVWFVAFGTSTLFVSTPLIGDWVIFVGGFSAILTVAAFVLTDPYLGKRRKRGQSNLRFDLLSHREKGAAYAGFALFFLLAVSGIPSITAGQPTKQGGRYFANDHGKLTPITHHAYERGIVGGERFFTGASAIAVLAALAGWRGRAVERRSVSG